MIKISKIKPNKSNPRTIKDTQFHKLVQSISSFPKMMELRPMIVDENWVILGGNMRFKALQELKYKEIPESWVKQAKDLTEDEVKEFIIKDNLGFGEWDWDELANNWDSEKLNEWGLNVPIFFDSKDVEEPEEEVKKVFKIEVICETKEEQESTYNKLIESNYNCHIA